MKGLALSKDCTFFPPVTYEMEKRLSDEKLEKQKKKKKKKEGAG